LVWFLCAYFSPLTCFLQVAEILGTRRNLA